MSQVLSGFYRPRALTALPPLEVSVYPHALGSGPRPPVGPQRDPAFPKAFPPQEPSIGGNASTSSYADASHDRSKLMNYKRLVHGPGPDILVYT